MTYEANPAYLPPPNSLGGGIEVMILLDKIVKALENGYYVIGVYLDFSKAFDTVDHGTLLLKLEHNGVRGSALKWFKSYLSDRQQYVTYKCLLS